MKAAKLTLCAIIAALILLSPLLLPATRTVSHARVTRYARADARDIYFCERKDLNYALFTIPYTYCVEILSSDGEWYYVKYAEDTSIYRALYGYCLSANLTPIDEPPAKIYLDMPVTVTFKPDSPPIGSLPVLNELNVTVAFYGTYYSGASAYSYVYYDGTFGYIYGANDDYPLNELPQPTPPPDDKTESGYNAKLLIGLAHAALAAAALVLIYFTSRKSKYFRPDR